MKALAFFPWWAGNEDLSIGRIRLIPYRRRSKPGNLPHVTQAEIDRVLRAYSTWPRRIVRDALLLEVDNWHLGENPEPVMARLFQAREALGFAALAERRLFAGSGAEYCNFDNFHLVVQPYLAGHTGHFAYNTRRRDGGTKNLWHTSEFAFHPPLHVHPMGAHTFETALVELLMTELPPSWRNAIAEYNCANTDAQELSDHVELVLMKSAFEWLLNVGSGVHDFVAALIKLMPPTSTETSPAWRRRYLTVSHPLDAWAKEFCDWRNAAAHASDRDHPRFVWSMRSHLAFASKLFPLIFKKVASDAGRYMLSAKDVASLAIIEQYLQHDPFEHRPAPSSASSPHPWALLDRDIDARANG